MRLVFARQSLDDLRAIRQFIAADDPAAARRFVFAIRRRCGVLRDYPEAGVSRDDLVRGLRIWSIPSRIVVAYWVPDRQVEVLRIFYAGQDYETILRSRTDD